MHEESRGEFRTVRQLFGDGCQLIETGPGAKCSGHVEIRLGGKLLGMGSNFRTALHDSFTGIADWRCYTQGQ